MPRRVPLAVALLATLLALGGCGGTSKRDRVADYVRQADAVQQDSAPAFRRANRSYVRFARGKLPAGAAAAALVRAERTIARARARLADLHPPRAAVRLHARLLAVYDENLGLARETTQLARYAPARAVAVRPLARAGLGLSTGLKAASAPAAQARVLGVYATRVDRVVARLRRLQAPPVTAPAHRALVRRLDSTAMLARKLRAAVTTRDTRRVARLIVAFRRVTASAAGSRAVTRAAVIAYQRRRRAIGHAVAATNRELARLDRATS